NFGEQLIVPEATWGNRHACEGRTRDVILPTEHRSGGVLVGVGAGQLMDLEELLEVTPPLWKPSVPLLGSRPLPQVLADDELGVNQLQSGLQVGGQFRIGREPVLGGAAFAGAQPPLQFGTCPTQLLLRRLIGLPVGMHGSHPDASGRLYKSRTAS